MYRELPYIILLPLISIVRGLDVKVKVSQGTLVGTQLSVGNTKVHSYLGVPFAEPPTGDLRFAAPVLKGPWDNERPAKTLSPACIQEKDTTFPGFKGSEIWNPSDHPIQEDCLYLNIWAPRGPKSTSKSDESTAPPSGLPVMVWIYGGGYMSGTPSLEIYDGRQLAATGNVIVININYRVNVFGFLYLGTDDSANMGLLDQQLALRWIHENIEAFGGDPNAITIFGESAGSSSVASHMLSPSSWPYFSKAILQSASVLNHWAVGSKDRMRNVSMELARRVDCYTDEDTKNSKPVVVKGYTIHRVSDEKILKCLRGVDAKKLSSEASKVTAGFLEFPFRPVDNDGVFFESSVESALDEERVKRCPIIIGMVSDEGSFWLPYYLPEYFTNQSRSLLNQSAFVDSVDKALAHLPASLRKSATFEYNVNLKSKCSRAASERSVELRDGINHLVGDYFFGCGVVEFADRLAEIYGTADSPSSSSSSSSSLSSSSRQAREVSNWVLSQRLRKVKKSLSQKSPPEIFAFYFDQRLSNNPWPTWMGTMHAYEIEYIFGTPVSQPGFRKDEIAFSKEVMGYWSNFAKTGRPSTVLEWPPMGAKRETRQLSASSQVVLENMKRSRCSFWKEVNDLSDAGTAAQLADEASSAVSRNISRWNKVQITFIFLILNLFHTYLQLGR